MFFEPEFVEFENQNGNRQRFGKFKCTNYGFRPGKNAYQALYNLKFEGKRTNIAIEGDIQGAYNNVDHNILLKTLSSRIKDKKFLLVMENSLKTGVMEKYHYEPGSLGPKVVSHLLFNI